MAFYVLLLFAGILQGIMSGMRPVRWSCRKKMRQVRKKTIDREKARK